MLQSPMNFSRDEGHALSQVFDNVPRAGRGTPHGDISLAVAVVVARYGNVVHFTEREVSGLLCATEVNDPDSLLRVWMCFPAGRARLRVRVVEDSGVGQLSPS